MSNKTTVPNIPAPTPSEVKKYLKKWNGSENQKYALAEKSLCKLFQETYPLNDDINDILIKVSALNSLYSTGIRGPSAVVTAAEHIIGLHKSTNIDKRLDNQDFELVREIARIELNNGKEIRNGFYSFATKYCSHHRPHVYPIYDSYVKDVLKYFRKKDKFSNFKAKNLKIYSDYRKILLQFREHYQLTKFNFKEMDMYLWQVGKEYLPSNY